MNLVPDQLSFVWVPSTADITPDGVPTNLANVVLVAIASSVLPQLLLLAALSAAWVAKWRSGALRGGAHVAVGVTRALFAVGLNYYGPNVLGLCVAVLSTTTAALQPIGLIFPVATYVLAVAGMLLELAVAGGCGAAICRTGRLVLGAPPAGGPFDSTEGDDEQQKAEERHPWDAHGDWIPTPSPRVLSDLCMWKAAPTNYTAS